MKSWRTAQHMARHGTALHSTAPHRILLHGTAPHPSTARTRAHTQTHTHTHTHNRELVAQMQRIFDRDWDSNFSSPLSL